MLSIATRHTLHFPLSMVPMGASSHNLSTLIITLTFLLIASFYLAVRRTVKQNVAASQVIGCRRIGLLDSSNMSDQFSTRHNGDGDTSECKVKALFIYPIKSCGRIELPESDVVATGLRYDRQFCFAQLHSEEAEKLDGDYGVNMDWNHKWKFITQRRFPRLSQVYTELWLPDTSLPGYSPDSEWVKSKGCLVCKFAFIPDWEWTSVFNLDTLRIIWTIIVAKVSEGSLRAEPMVTFRLPIVPDVKRSFKYSRDVMHIWKDAPEAINVTSEIEQETLAKLKYFLGVSNPLGLFMADPEKPRDVFRNAPTKEEAGYQPGTGFADAYPLSIMGIASVHDVAKKLPKTQSLDALRFRANIYLTGAPAYTEDTWKLIRMGNLSYHVSCRTTRCQLPNVDQDTGIADRHEPSTTLKKFRAYVDEGAGSNPCLGMQMVPMLKGRKDFESIAAGQSVEVLETGKHFYVRMFQ